MFYPIIFEPIYKQMIWGGERLKTLFGRKLPSADVGESWDISCRPGEMGVVRNGDLQGKTFYEVINLDLEGFLGKAHATLEEFPLLVKLIDANDNLSVQVHPPGEKNEVWYVIYAPEGAMLNVGLASGTKKEDLLSAISSGEVEKYLNYIPVKSGDAINISAGTVHSISAGLIIAEIQQNSDITYRVYDYGRVDASGKPRQLHIDEALAAIDFEAECGLLNGQASVVPGGTVVFYCKTDYYTLYEYFVDTCIREDSDPDRFYIFTCVDGSCEISSSEFCTKVAAGDCVFIPAALGAYEIKGRCRLLKSFVP
ncbi:MAG: class I mannose-6-phosphate isomerase [Oscillospiraceae bacterium]|nr:class I mannose-6-phosphate isomerase [Oscillospiraceae bacterium]